MSTATLPEPPPADARAAEIYAELVRAILSPRPDFNILEWSEKFRRLPKTDRGGMWRARQVPYLVAPLLALSDPRCREVSIKKSAQSGATIGVLLNWLFYTIHADPCNVLLMYPTEGEAQKFSKKKFAPALEAMTALRGLISDPGSRKGDNTTLEKSFPGGSLGIIGGVSARGLRLVDTRRYAGDDIDSLDDTTDEGSQIWLLRRRAGAQWGSQGLWISSPGDEGSSKITQLYDEMDRRGRFHVPCPHCEHMQVLRFGDPDSDYGLKWDQQKGLGGTTKHYPETAEYLCENCGTLINERYKYQMVQAGDYLADDGEPVYNGEVSTYGFWYNAFVTLFPQVSWGKIADTFLKTKDDPTNLKVTVNTVFAETWDDTEIDIEKDELKERAVPYVSASGARVEVPDGVGVLTAFADVQHDRIELLIRGFGDREVSWQILHQRIHGDTDQDAVYQQLDSWWQRVYRHESGAPMRIMAMGIDSGDGARVDQVYKYARKRDRYGVYPTKGSSDRKMKEPVRVGKKTKAKPYRLVTINTYALKRTMFFRLGKKLDMGRPPPAGYMHFRAAEPKWHNGSDGEFFDQFERERPKKRKLPTGKFVTEWVTTGDNEAVDLEVGCLAMLRVLQQGNVRFRDELAELAEEARDAERYRKLNDGRPRGRRVRHGGIR